MQVTAILIMIALFQVGWCWYAVLSRSLPVTVTQVTIYRLTD